MNKAILMGRLTQDPELRSTPNGISVTTFSLAINRRFAKAGEQPQADFINIVCWRSTAEFVAKYFKKGQQMALVGSIQTRKWQDKDGNNRYATEVVADRVILCGFEKDSSGSGSAYSGGGNNNNTFRPPVQEVGYTPASSSDFEEIDTDDGELPF